MCLFQYKRVCVPVATTGTILKRLLDVFNNIKCSLYIIYLLRNNRADLSKLEKVEKSAELSFLYYLKILKRSKLTRSQYLVPGLNISEYYLFYLFFLVFFILIFALI